MATIVRGTVPVSEFALSTTVGEHADASFETERIVKSAEDAIMPLLWVRGPDSESVEAAFEGDDTVAGVSRLADFGDEILYRMEWVGKVRLLFQMISNANATVLDAYGRDGQWQLRVLYPDRDAFAATHDFCHEHELTFDVDSIREMNAEPAGRFGLTEKQYQALVLAVRRGYYSVPQEVTLEELADEVGISHQAFSERLRRGTGTLAGDALVVGESP